MNTLLIASLSCFLQFPKSGESTPELVLSDAGPWKITSRERRRFGWRSWQTPSIDLADESFHVVVPANYTGDGSFGLLVYISPSPTGRMLGPTDLDNVLSAHKLVFIAPNKVQNRRPPLERMQLALIGAHNMKQQYAIDKDRVVVAGFSGGAKMAGITARFAPEEFRGVVPIGGASFHRLVRAGPRTAYPNDMKLSSGAERKARERLSFAFITGPKDFNYEPIVKIERAYRESRFRSKLIVVPGLGHSIPGPEPIKEALKFVLREE